MKTILLLTCLVALPSVFGLWCYQCSPALPGCNPPFNWRGMGYLGDKCPEENDICVKLIERKGAEEVVTRDCLSNFQALRTDIPTDHYEGCRKSTNDFRLAHYVNNSIKEYDVKREYYDETIWCFCFLDHRCNGSSFVKLSMSVFVISIVCHVFKNLM